MKTIPRGAIVGAGILLASNIHTLAIEGLQLSLQCSNVVLSWPSRPGQNYIVQYRPSLAPNTPWRTLTNSYPTDWNTNVLIFVHSNIVRYPNCRGAGGGSPIAMLPTALGVATVVEPPVCVAMPADGTGSAVPLTLYPPGFGLSELVILDPSTGDWVSGTAFTRTLGVTGLNGPEDDPPPPGPGDGDTNSIPPDAGFYQVV